MGGDNKIALFRILFYFWCKPEAPMKFYPIFLRTEGARILLAGGGEAAVAISPDIFGRSLRAHLTIPL